jgi:hypothetical protein
MEKGQPFLHGTRPEDAKELISSILSLLRSEPGPSGRIGEITVHLLDDFPHDISKDEDFAPRIYLSARGHLEICARNPQEANALGKAIAYLASMGALESYDLSGWKTWQIPGNIQHNFVFEYDVQFFDRVVLKIIYGLIGAYFRVHDRSHLNLPAVRSVVRGDSEVQPGMVTPLFRLSGPVSVRTDQLIAAAAVRKGRLLGLVGFYGEWYAAGLGIPSDCPGLPYAIGAMCRVVKDREQRWLSTTEAEEVMRSCSSSLGAPLSSMGARLV